MNNTPLLRVLKVFTHLLLSCKPQTYNTTQHNTTVKDRIIGTANIHKITKSMKMVSAAKLRGDQQRLSSAAPFGVSENLTYFIFVYIFCLEFVVICWFLHCVGFHTLYDTLFISKQKWAAKLTGDNQMLEELDVSHFPAHNLLVCCYTDCPAW
jgi:hypothetical protein